MDPGTFATLAVTILLAFISYIVTYYNNLRLARRKDRLNRINQQLSELYGPLISLTTATDSTWVAFRTLYRPSEAAFWDPDRPPTADEAAAWRLWMRNAFMPLNRKMMDYIVEGAHLLREPNMPNSFLSLSAHVANYEALLKEWDEGNFSSHVPVNTYPGDELRQHVWHQFSTLKNEQEKLLGGLPTRKA